MTERGNKKNRLIDRYLGIPLTIPAALFRRIDRPGKPKKITTAAVICLGAIGDLLLTSGLINALRAEGVAVDLYTSKANEQAARLLANVRESSPYRLSEIPVMIGKIRKNRYDLLIDTTQWARVGSLVSAFSKAGLTVGFRTQGEYRSLPYDVKVTHNRTIHEWENFLNLAKAVLPDADGRPGIIIQSGADLPGGKYMLLHMWASGTHGPEKQWMPEKWAELARELIGRGFTVLFTGSAADAEKTSAFIAEHLPDTEDIMNAAGTYSLPELAEVIRHSAGVVSVNTGMMHLAALSGAPTAGLHGPSNPRRWGPVGSNTFAVVHTGVENFPDMEFSKTCDDRSFTCHVTVSEALDALRELKVF